MLNKLFLKLVGAIAFIIAIGAICLCVIFSYQLIKPAGSTNVNYEEINIPTGDTSTTKSKPIKRPKVDASDRVVKYMSGNNANVMSGWLDSIPSHEERVDFVSNMDEVIKEAEKNNVDVFKVINNYKKIKFDRINQYHSQKYERMATKATSGLMILLGAITLLFSGSVIVLLRIEQNTSQGTSCS